MKKAMIIGAGKIGRGFIAQLMALNGWELCFAEKSSELVEQLVEAKKYTVHILGNESKSTVVSSYQACTLEDSVSLNRFWQESDLIFTSVGGKNLQSLGPILGKAVKGWLKEGPVSSVKNMITCENWKEPAAELKRAIEAQLDEEEQALFHKHAGVTEGVVMRVAVDSSAEQRAQFPVDVWVQDFWDLPVDRDRFIGTPPDLSYVQFIEEFGHFLERKIYTNNTSNAAIAYLGYLKGYTYTADAANDSEIERVLDQVYEEINQMLVKALGVSYEEQRQFAAKAKAKYSDKRIVDFLYRHAADPIRKLGPQDRLIAPARMAIRHGVIPKAIVKTIAAALYYDYGQDPIAQELRRLRETKGIDGVLMEVCKLTPDEPLYGLVKEELSNQNLI